MTQKLKRCVLHHANYYDKIYNQHDNHRSKRCFYECTRIPDCVVCQQAVAVVIHAHNHILEYRIAQYISYYCCQKCHNDRH